MAISGGKHLVLANGDLYIQDVSQADRYRQYTCRTLHKLTTQTRASRVPGKVIITGELHVTALAKRMAILFTEVKPSEKNIYCFCSRQKPSSVAL